MIGKIILKVFTKPLLVGGLVSKSCLHFVPPSTVSCQAPPSMGFSRQEFWSGLSFPSPGDLPDPGINPRSPALQADSLPTDLRGKLCNIMSYFSYNLIFILYLYEK